MIARLITAPRAAFHDVARNVALCGVFGVWTRAPEGQIATCPTCLAQRRRMVEERDRETQRMTREANARRMGEMAVWGESEEP